MKIVRLAQLDVDPDMVRETANEQVRFYCGRRSSVWQTSSLKRSWYSWTEPVKVLTVNSCIKVRLMTCKQTSLPS
jgi:hypothetical protein